MGLFGWIGEKISSACNYVKEKATKVKDKIKEKASNIWGAFTGKNKVKEAERIYNDSSGNFELAKSDFDKYVDDKSKEINTIINKINRYKDIGYNKYLTEYVNITKKLYNFNLGEIENFDGDFKYVFENIKLKDKKDIFTIDFENNKFKTTVQAIFTLGFYTRKKAKETLVNAKEYERAVEYEIEKMESEKQRIEMIIKSLKAIEHYFDGIFEIMDGLLERLNYSLDYLRNIHLIFSYSFIKGKLNYKKLPEAQANYFMASYTFCEIISKMIKMNYIKSSNEINNNDIKKAKEGFKKLKEEAEKIGA